MRSDESEATALATAPKLLLTDHELAIINGGTFATTTEVSDSLQPGAYS